MHEIGGTRMQAPRILDPCCGSRMFYFDRAHPDVLFGDLRSETIVVRDRSHGREDGTRTLHIRPDMRGWIFGRCHLLTARSRSSYSTRRTWCARGKIVACRQVRQIVGELAGRHRRRIPRVFPRAEK